MIFGKYLDPASLLQYTGVEGNDVEEEEYLEEEENGNEEHGEEDDYRIINEASFETISNAGSEVSQTFQWERCHQETSQSITRIFLPPEFSQSSMNGEEGSNACLVIASLMGYLLSHRPVSFENNALRFCEQVIPLFCGATETGNMIYKYHNFRGFLITPEVLDALPPSIQLELVEEKNLLVNDNEENSVVSYLKEMIHHPSSFFSIIIVRDYAYCLKTVGNRIVLVDSHANGLYGGKFTLINAQSLKAEELSFPKVEMVYSCLIKLK